MDKSFCTWKLFLNIKVFSWKTVKNYRNKEKQFFWDRIDLHLRFIIQKFPDYQKKWRQVQPKCNWKFFAKIKFLNIGCEMAQTGITKSFVNFINSLEMIIAWPFHWLAYGKNRYHQIQIVILQHVDLICGKIL